MHKSTEHEAATTTEAAADQPLAQPNVNSAWSTIQSQVARAVPRLREIATTTALLSPIFLEGYAWGGGGRGGC